MRIPAFLLAFFVALPVAHAIESVKLTDVIKSSGTGNINLLKDVTAANLEAYRQDAGGSLLLAVDVNENAEGTEKANSQAVAVASVKLTATIAGQQQVFTSYTTNTQALLAGSGTTVRSPYFTMIGESGSSRITSNAIQDEFDTVLEIPVNVNLSTATAVTVDIVLLNVNATLGDPEKFYDFTNGFEDLAIVNRADADFFDQLAAGQSEAPGVILTYPPPEPSVTASSWTSYPSATEYYFIGYEDLFPSIGDYDFNDLVVAFRMDVGTNSNGQIVALTGSAYPIARGAGYSHDWHLRIPFGGSGASGSLSTTRFVSATAPGVTESISFSGEPVIVGFVDDRTAFPPASGFAFTNTQEGSPFQTGPRLDFVATIDPPVPASRLGAAPFDPYIIVRDTGYEVHLPGHAPSPSSQNVIDGYTSFKDPRGYPFAMLIPTNWSFPWERIDMGVAYPELSVYISSQEKQGLGWYTSPAPERVRSYGQASWEWSPH